MTVPKPVTVPVVLNKPLVHIYFCTADTCAKEATQAQMSAVSRRASASPWVAGVIFESKEETLATLRRKYPEEVKALPSNPFPDSLWVMAKRPQDVEKIAALFRRDPALGIDKINYDR